VAEPQPVQPVLTLDGLLDERPQITRAEALEVPMAAACVEWITGTAARLPVQLFKIGSGEVAEVEDDPRVQLLNGDTGDILNGFQMKKAWCRDYLLEGAGYIFLERRRNEVTGLYYVDAEQVSVLKSPDPIYKQASFVIGGSFCRQHELLRITRNTLDGVTGLGLLKENPLILSTAYQTFRYQRQLVQAGGCRKGFLLAEKTVSKEIMDTLKAAWKRLFKSGDENVIVLNNGIKFQEAANTSVEMQLNENKRADGESICNLFGLSAALFSGSAGEEAYNAAVKTAVLPLLDAMDAAYNQNLLLESEKGKYYFSTDTRSLLRGDIERRFAAYKLAAEANIMQIDEIRRLENLPALGMEFVKLGLQDVLYNPKTKEIFTPNTGVKARLDELRIGQPEQPEKTLTDEPEPDIIEPRGCYIQGADGKMQGSLPGPGGGSGSKKKKPHYAPSKQRQRKGIHMSPKKYAKLCGTLGTQHPKAKAGDVYTIRDAGTLYRVEADGYGGLAVLWRRKIE